MITNALAKCEKKTLTNYKVFVKLTKLSNSMASLSDIGLARI